MRSQNLMKSSKSIKTDPTYPKGRFQIRAQIQFNLTAKLKLNADVQQTLTQNTYKPMPCYFIYVLAVSSLINKIMIRGPIKHFCI